MLDESLLDDAEALTRVDTGELLLGLAGAGARVRTAARRADEAGLAGLHPDGRPRAVLVAGEAAALHAGQVLAALSGATCPILPVPASGPGAARPGPTGPGLRWSLPGWASALDLVLIASPQGAETGLTDLVEQCYQRGCTVVVVAPAGSPLADAAQQASGLALPFVAPPRPPAAADVGVVWALLVPLVALADRIGVVSAPPDAVQAAADRLDQVAGGCRPAAGTYQNPAKTLAVELAGTLPLLWAEGPRSAAVAERFSFILSERAGRPALYAPVPDALTAHRGLLAGEFAGGNHLDEFFRDRVDEPDEPGRASLRIVLVREGAGEYALGSAATPAHQLAQEHGVPLSELAATPQGSGSLGSGLPNVAELFALTDFAAAYLALGAFR